MIQIKLLYYYKSMIKRLNLIHYIVICYLIG